MGIMRSWMMSWGGEGRRPSREGLASLALVLLLLSSAVGQQGRGGQGSIRELEKAAEASIVSGRDRCMEDLNNLALGYSSAKRYHESSRAYRTALRMRRGLDDQRGVGVMLNLGNVLVEMKEYEEARVLYAAMLSLSPDYAIGRYSLGRTFDKAGRYEESLPHYRAASALDPTLPNPHSNEGVALLNLGRPRDAVKPLEAAVRLRPDHPEDLNSLGDALADSERYEEGIERYRQAIDAAPGGYFPKSLYSMLHYLIHTCRWKELEEACRGLEATLSREMAEGGETQMTPIESLVLIGTYTDEALLSRVVHNFALRSMYRISASGDGPRLLPPYKGLAPASAALGARKRLRLGYISGGLRQHPDGKNMNGVFERHDRRLVEVHCFSLLRDEGSKEQQHIIETCERYHDFTGVPNKDVAVAVNRLGINVLLDVNGYTGEGVRSQRNIVLALTPAPVQVNFLAWVATTGAPFIQYIITDRVASPPELQGSYSEKLMLMPSSYFPSNLRNGLPPPPSPPPRGRKRGGRKDRGLPVEGALLSGFNQLWKIDASLFTAWMEILSRAKNATLWLPLFPDVARPALDVMARKKGLGDRILWTPLYPEDQHLAVKSLASLQLDTCVYNGHTSGADILWAGVPTLTLPGIKQSARVGASLLNGLGLGRFLIARNMGDYADVAAAASMGGEEGVWLEDVRARLDKARIEAPLFDVQAWVIGAEAIARMSWEVYTMGAKRGSSSKKGSPMHIIAAGGRRP